MTNRDKEQSEELLRLIVTTIQHDKELREKYQIGDKFRFIQDRLKALQTQAEESLQSLQKKVEKETSLLAEDEVVVYVHLYNAQGIAFQTWQKMTAPAVFYEYSINRPIYAEKSHIESFIRSRTNKVQHAYLAVAIKKTDILPIVEIPKDAVGNPLIKIREGSLRFNRLVFFVHNNHEYTMREGQLVKKE